MQPPTEPAGPQPGESGEPGERRRLDRPPSERYGPSPSADVEVPGGPPRAVRALIPALIGAAIIAVLGGPLSVTFGLIGVAAVTGWAVGSLARPSLALAVGLAIGAIALGLVGIWLFARLEGGVLGLPEYLAQVHGALVPISFAAAGVMAAATVR